MYKATDIANFLVYLMTDSCDDLTNMKLNKILYYAQGHYLQKYGKPLFEDCIEAWPHGPVIRSVYAKYKDFTDRRITAYDVAQIQCIDDDTKSYLVDVARKYGRFTASTLRNMTHKPKTPWSEVQIGEEITTKLIYDYFVKNEEKLGPLEIHYTENDFVGHRDSDGILVLPEDWHDEEV